LISNLFRLVEQAQNPEKLAENAYLMKCKEVADGVLLFNDIFFLLSSQVLLFLFIHG